MEQIFIREFQVAFFVRHT